MGASAADGVRPVPQLLYLGSDRNPSELPRVSSRFDRKNGLVSSRTLLSGAGGEVIQGFRTRPWRSDCRVRKQNKAVAVSDEFESQSEMVGTRIRSE